jgi:hypothetical protein
MTNTTNKEHSMGIRVRTVEKYQPVTSEDPVTADEVRTKLRAVMVLHEMVKHKDTGLFPLRSFIEAVQEQVSIDHNRNKDNAKHEAKITIRHDGLDA